mgnify:CR=1 FL=1
MILLRNIFTCFVFFISLYNTGLSDHMVIDTFNNNPEERWIYFADTVMGGQSEGAVAFKTGSQGEYARLTGNVNTKNNGGFVQIRKRISGLDKDMAGIKLTAKGNNQTYHIFIRTSGTVLPWQYYKAEFLVRNSWKKIKIPIADFQRSSSFLSRKIKPETIKSIGLVAFGRDFSADLYVSEVSFY